MKAQASRFIGVSGRVLLGLSPLLLAIAFYLTFRFFDGNIGLEAVTWKDADRVNQAAAKELSEAEQVVVQAQARLAKIRGADSTKAGAEAETQAAIATAKSLRDSLEKPPLSDTASELSLRLCWGAAASIFSFLVLLVGAQSIREIDDVVNRSSPAAPTNRPQRVLLLAAMAAVAVIVCVWLTYRDRYNLSSSVASEPATELFQALQGSNKDLAGTERAATAAVPKLALLLSWMNHASGVAILLVAAAVSAVVWHLHGKLRLLLAGKVADTELPAVARWLDVTGARAVTLMQLTAAALIMGVVEVLLLYLLASHHVRPTLQADARALAQVISFTGGLIYTGLLAAIYLPLYDALKSFRSELSHRLTQATPAAIVGTDSENVFSIPVVKSLVTIFSPVLVTILAALAGGLNEVFARWIK